MTEKRVVLTGATGMIGGLALRLALSDPAVGSVTSIGRRSADVVHPKLTQITHQDFTNFRTLESGLVDQDVALFCLGAYTGAVPDDEFKKITVDYTVSFAEALIEKSPEAVFCLLSGQGSDQTEKSRISFARYKGMAENALLAMGFSRVHLFRPGYIYPVTKGPVPNVPHRAMFKVMRSLYPIVRRLYPNIGIPSDDLAKAMLHAGLHGTEGHPSPILENRDIRRLAERIG